MATNDPEFTATRVEHLLGILQAIVQQYGTAIEGGKALRVSEIHLQDRTALTTTRDSETRDLVLIVTTKR